MKEKNDRTLGDAIREMIDTYRMEDKLDEVKILDSWEKVVGKIIVKYTRNIYIKNRKLYVTLNSPSLKNEVSYSRSQIVERLNEEAGRQVIDELVLL